MMNKYEIRNNNISKKKKINTYETKYEYEFILIRNFMIAQLNLKIYWVFCYRYPKM